MPRRPSAPRPGSTPAPHPPRGPPASLRECPRASAAASTPRRRSWSAWRSSPRAPGPSTTLRGTSRNSPRSSNRTSPRSTLPSPNSKRTPATPRRRNKDKITPSPSSTRSNRGSWAPRNRSKKCSRNGKRWSRNRTNEGRGTGERASGRTGRTPFEEPTLAKDPEAPFPERRIRRTAAWAPVTRRAPWRGSSHQGPGVAYKAADRCPRTTAGVAVSRLATRRRVSCWCKGRTSTSARGPRRCKTSSGPSRNSAGSSSSWRRWCRSKVSWRCGSTRT